MTIYKVLAINPNWDKGIQKSTCYGNFVDRERAVEERRKLKMLGFVKVSIKQRQLKGKQ